MAERVIDVAGLVKEFPNGTRALDGVNLRVRSGETVVLLGANGSGKSTLQKCLTKLVTPTEGSVNVLGTEVSTASKKEVQQLRTEVGVVFQKINLVRELSVLTNVIHGSLGRVRSSRNWFSMTARSEQRDEAMEALERVGLAHVAGRRAVALRDGRVDMDTYMSQVADEQLEGLYTHEDEEHGTAHAQRSPRPERVLEGAAR